MNIFNQIMLLSLVQRHRNFVHALPRGLNNMQKKKTGFPETLKKCFRDYQ